MVFNDSSGWKHHSGANTHPLIVYDLSGLESVSNGAAIMQVAL